MKRIKRMTSPEQREQIFNLIGGTVSDTQIAAIVGVIPQTVTYYRHLANIPPFSRSKWYGDTLAELISYINDGYTRISVAAHFDVTPGSLSRTCNLLREQGFDIPKFNKHKNITPLNL